MKKAPVCSLHFPHDVFSAPLRLLADDFPPFTAIQARAHTARHSLSPCQSLSKNREPRTAAAMAGPRRPPATNVRRSIGSLGRHGNGPALSASFPMATTQNSFPHLRQFPQQTCATCRARIQPILHDQPFDDSAAPGTWQEHHVPIIVANFSIAPKFFLQGIPASSALQNHIDSQRADDQKST